MTEQEFYDACNLWLNEIRAEAGDPIPEGESRTFILVAIHETDEKVGNAFSIVNPDFREATGKASQAFANLPDWGQQIAAIAIHQVKDLVDGITKKVIEMHNIARSAGIDIAQAMEIYDECENAEQFVERLSDLRKQKEG